MIGPVSDTLGVMTNNDSNCLLLSHIRGILDVPRTITVLSRCALTIFDPSTYCSVDASARVIFSQMRTVVTFRQA